MLDILRKNPKQLHFLKVFSAAILLMVGIVIVHDLGWITKQGVKIALSALGAAYASFSGWNWLKSAVLRAPKSLVKVGELSPDTTIGEILKPQIEFMEKQSLINARAASYAVTAAYIYLMHVLIEYFVYIGLPHT